MLVAIRKLRRWFKPSRYHAKGGSTQPSPQGSRVWLALFGLMAWAAPRNDEEALLIALFAISQLIEFTLGSKEMRQDPRKSLRVAQWNQRDATE